MCNFKLNHSLQYLVHNRCSIDVCRIKILLNSVLGETIMFATSISLRPHRRVGVVCCGHVRRKTPRAGGHHNLKIKVTEFSLRSHISAVWVRRRNYSAEGTGVFFFQFLFVILLNGLIMLRPNWPLQQCLPRPCNAFWFYGKKQVCS